MNRIEDEPAKCWAAEDFTVNPAWLSNYGLLKKYNLGFDLMCFSNMMHRMADLAHKHPDIMIYVITSYSIHYTKLYEPYPEKLNLT